MHFFKPLKWLVLLVYVLSGPCAWAQESPRYLPNDFLVLKNKAGDTVAPIDLAYLEFLGVPEAWHETTGHRQVIIGLSDGAIDTTLLDFSGKTKILQKAPLASGHGLSVGSIAAAQGDNNFGIPGVCYDCSLLTTVFGNPNMEMLLELGLNGAKVINASWVTSQKTARAQEVIDTLMAMGTVVVAGAGNQSWKKNKGQKYYYPASLDKVISVSSVMFLHQNPLEGLDYEADGRPFVENVMGFVGRTAGFDGYDTSRPLRIYPESVATLNTEVDLLAPTVGLFRYNKWILEDEVVMGTYQGTSSATPLVSGTIGLMNALCPCLPAQEIESILKITALNIDHIEANKPYYGHYGAGILQTGKAVSLVKNLYDIHAEVSLSEQQFDRWDFLLTSYAQSVRLSHLRFSGSSALDLTSRTAIVLGPGTHFQPEVQSKGIHLKINEGQWPPCALRTKNHDADR